MDTLARMGRDAADVLIDTEDFPPGFDVISEE
jgi:hypothetical protein